MKENDPELVDFLEVSKRKVFGAIFYSNLILFLFVEMSNNWSKA